MRRDSNHVCRVHGTPAVGGQEPGNGAGQGGVGKVGETTTGSSVFLSGSWLLPRTSANDEAQGRMLRDPSQRRLSSPQRLTDVATEVRDSIPLTVGWSLVLTAHTHITVEPWVVTHTTVHALS